MAKAILPALTLSGNDTKSFLKEIKIPNKIENEIKQRISSGRHVDFF